MSQTALLLDTLKKTLRQRGITYQALAQRLGLSEPTVKRIFSEKNITLERLEKICQLIEIELIDLAKLAAENQSLIEELSHEQEKQLVAEPKLLLLAYLLVHGLSYQQISAIYQIDELEGVRLLAQLDKLNLIELQPGNKVKTLTSPNFAWRNGGPIQKYFDQTIKQEFFQSNFKSEGELMLFASGMVTQETMHRFHRKFEKLLAEFHQAAKADSLLPLEQRHGCSLVTAFRPWELSAFAALRREI